MNIEIIKPFENAFELMKKILFQPFDLKKWCVIGFAAWLARIGSGGGYNFQYNRPADLRNHPAVQQFADWVHQIPIWVFVMGVSAIALLVLTLLVLFAWLRARGAFIFTDCIVKNRAAIAEPWREFRREANSYFMFSLFFVCVLVLLAMSLSLPLVIAIAGGKGVPHRHGVLLICMILIWAVIVVIVTIGWAVLSHIMVISMYRRRSRAAEEFRRAITLISNYPGEITLYCLFSIAIAIAAVFASCTVLCATCCIAAIPYVGTVILLPVWVWIRAFALLFFRQFGPDYDVWIEQPAPNELPSVPPLPS